MNDNDFIKLMCLGSDPSIKIYEVRTFEKTKYIEIGREPLPTFCDLCGSRMHSKGITLRHPNHPVFNDSYEFILTVRQRRWKCPKCGKPYTEEFPFLEKHSHSTSITTMLILEEMKDLNRSAASIARKFNVSDTHVHDVFTSFVDLKRLPLPEYLALDEVYLNIGNDMKYSLVLMDFQTGQPVDILKNRWMQTMEEYFLKIPRKERSNVKCIIADGYAPYAEIAKTFFPKAFLVLDSFHVVKKLIYLINGYIKDVLKKYKQINDVKKEKINFENNRQYNEIKDSKEMYLLKCHRWVMLKNMDSIEYDTKQYYNKNMGMVVDSYKIEAEFMKLDNQFETIRDLKEEFIKFNNRKYHEDVEKELDDIIKSYKSSNISIFIEFSEFIEKHKEPIMNSFSMMKVERKASSENNMRSRLSNGPLESFNRKPKDFKRNSRGFSNFDYTRNRILWATRNNPEILAIPKKQEQIHSYEGKKRGKYKKRNKQ